MPKTIILAIFTLLLAVAALVTNLVSPYPGGVDSAAQAFPAQATPAQLQSSQPGRAPLRAPARGPVMQASMNANFGSI
ncbi:MAG: hypothetical protein PSV22_04175 [Pseudolabrys sp.]|jgi:hypothetical protein|nr:hypothetical protein [Pseudolabrys sp.]